MSCSLNEPDCSLVRGTSTRQPNNGLVSHHDNRSRSRTTSPTTAMAVGVAPRTSCSIDSSVDTTVCCWRVAPSDVNGLESSRIDDLDVGACVRHRLLAQPALHDDDIRGREDVGGSERQQTGVSRPGPDEGDDADLLPGA